MKRYVYNNVAIDLHIQESNEDLEVVSLGYKQLSDIYSLTLDNETITCKVNCNFFEMNSGSPTYKEQQGVRQGLHPDGSICDEAPKQANWLVVAVGLDNKLKPICYSDNYWLWEKDVKCAFSPAFVLIHNNVDTEWYSKSRAGTINNSTNQTMFMQLADGRYAVAITQSGLTAKQCRTWAKTIGATHLSILDGGGSTQCIEYGKKIRTTGRAIPSVLAFVKRGADVTTPEPTLYDYTSANDLVKWALEQKDKPNVYNLDRGIGRYVGNVRQFDCTGLVKCFVWHDYSEKNASYYGKNLADTKFLNVMNSAKYKGSMTSIPEIKGLIVYRYAQSDGYEHVGIYMGNGQVVESTYSIKGVVQKKIIVSQFLDSSKADYRAWDNWFKLDCLNYDEEIKEEVSDMILEITNSNQQSFRTSPNGSTWVEQGYQVKGEKFTVDYIENTKINGFRWAKVKRIKDNKVGFIQCDYANVDLYGPCSQEADIKFEEVSEKLYRIAK